MAAKLLSCLHIINCYPPPPAETIHLGSPHLMSGAIHQALHLWFHEIDEYLWTVYLTSVFYNHKELSYQIMCCICIKHAHTRNLNDKGKTCTSSMRTVVGERKSRRCSRTIAESRMTNIFQVLAGALFSLKFELLSFVREFRQPIRLWVI